MDARPRRRRAGLDHEQPAIDLLPPVHARRIFLTDEAALVEADAVQFGSVAFEPEKVAELSAALADTKAKAMFKPAVGGLVRRAPASGGRARRAVDRACPRPSATNGRQVLIALDADRPPQPIERQALDQIVRRLGFAVEQQVIAIRPHEKIEQAFALRRQKPGPDRQRARRRRW